MTKLAYSNSLFNVNGDAGDLGSPMVDSVKPGNPDPVLDSRRGAGLVFLCNCTFDPHTYAADIIRKPQQITEGAEVKV